MSLTSLKGVQREFATALPPSCRRSGHCLWRQPQKFGALAEAISTVRISSKAVFPHFNTSKPDASTRFVTWISKTGFPIAEYEGKSPDEIIAAVERKVKEREELLLWSTATAETMMKKNTQTTTNMNEEEHIEEEGDAEEEVCTTPTPHPGICSPPGESEEVKARETRPPLLKM